MKKRPIIGIMPLFDEFKDSYWMLPAYMLCLEEYGACPMMMPLSDDEDVIDNLISVCDGFLFSGGHDIDPKLYNEEKKEKCGTPCVQRDKMEEQLFFKAIKNDKPILGICRGLQIINVLLGGSLYQDLPSELGINHEQSAPYDRVFHEVDIIKDTPLYDILNKSTIGVNSYHHQAVKVLSPKLKAMALSKDKLVEAVYMEDKKFVMAVQWHPEFSYKKDDSSVKIIREFINKCK